ncbi:MAG: YicC/YloC family endoribonuclease [bacterium]
MAVSMTGLGIGEKRNKDYRVRVELRSVNNRYLEVSCKLPSVLSYYENKVKEIIRGKIARGKIYISTTINSDTDDLLGIRVNSQMAKATYNLLNDLRNYAGIQEELKLEHFLNFSEIFEPLEPFKDAEKIWGQVKETLNIALDKLMTMRENEGNNLTRDILQRIELLTEHLKKIEKFSDKLFDRKINKFREDVHNLIKETDINEERLQTEIVLMAKKADISEECVRMKSHYKQFRTIIQDERVVGKKLIFLLQEMNREVNTISSKTSSSEISHIVVDMKEEIEKIREQVQNLE